MFSVRVMPLSRGIFKDELTFFSREPVSAGHVLAVTVRGRKIPALAVSSTDVREERQDIRSADFTLKKLELETPPKRIFSESFMDAVRETAVWHGTRDGAVLSALAPSGILAAVARVEEAPPSPERHEGVKSEFLLLQADREERVRTYRNLVREAFARNASVVVVCPTVVESEIIAEELSRGIENRVMLVTSELTKKKLVSSWNRAVTETSAVVIVGTPAVLSIPRPGIDTIVVERESAKSYRMRERPSLDARKVAEYVSRASGARLIFADFPLRAETRYRLKNHDAEELSRLQARSAGAEQIHIVDARAHEEKRGEKRMFSTLSAETKNEIRNVIERKGRVAVFAARKGLAPLTVCNDCGTPVTDPVTGTPMVLHRTEKGNVFVSHKSGAIVPAEVSCRTCGGWNLVTLGIGVDRVYQELAREFPDAPLFLFTKEGAPTHKSAKKLSASFFEEPGAIVVGTERMLPYLARTVDTAVVASIDSMLSLPAWRAHEQALAILYYLRERGKRSMIVETRDPEHAVMKSLASGNPADFYTDEIAEREKYSYPPFSVFIGLKASGTQHEVEKTASAIADAFPDLDLVGPLPAEHVTRSTWSVRAVIRLPRDAWPDPKLSERLKNLPPSVAVSIDPDEIV